jgi:hypothetical protein
MQRECIQDHQKVEEAVMCNRFAFVKAEGADLIDRVKEMGGSDNSLF